MRRLLPILVAPLLLAGCNWPQGWHWPRTTSNGSTATSTLVCVQNDVVGYQGPYVAWAKDFWDRSPTVHFRMVDTCPAGQNRIVVRTANIWGGTTVGGLTNVSIGGAAHLVAATITLDDGTGRYGTITDSKRVVYHEFCHALGGGYGDGAVHTMCNYDHWPHNFDELAQVYNHTR